MTDDALSAHLQQLEEELLRPAVRRDSRRIAELLAEEFREFGSSGRVFDRTAMLAELAAEPPADITLTDFACRLLSRDVALVTYRSQRKDALGTRNALRSSLWIHRDGRWQILFHQGTRI